MTEDATVDKKSALVTRRDATCPRCGAAFACGAGGADGSCWCAVLPALDGKPDPSRGCMCPACLQAALAAARIAATAVRTASPDPGQA